MTMNEKICDFVENYGNAFIVGSLTTKKQIYINKTAKELFGISLENCDFSEIFDRTELRLNEVIQRSLALDEVCKIYDVPANKANGEKIIVDIQIGFFNKDKTEIFLVVMPYNEKTELIALNQIDRSSKAEAILENDDNLTIYHCNEKFYNMLGYDSFQEITKNYDKNIPFLLFEKKDTILKEIKQSFEEGKNFEKEIQICSAKNDKKWIFLELQKRKISESSEKIMCFITNIEKNKENENKLNTFSKYFSAMQTLSNESLYTIDVKTRILRKKGVVAEELGIHTDITGYPESVYGLIHEDDLDVFKNFAENSLKGIEGNCKMRTLTANNEFVWYELNSMIIRDENNEVTEILGKMKNIHKEQLMEDEHTQLNKYFSTMQELSDDVLYRVDVETMTLYHMMKSKKLNLIGNEIPNYIETFIKEKIVHPDDADRYVDYVKKWYDDEIEEGQIRFAIDSSEYKWYNMVGKKIFDKNGKLTEVFGKLVNIQEKKELEEQASHDMMTKTLNKVSFENEVQEILKNSNNNDSHALLFIDLDDFKYVNDNLGHSFGDYLLIELGERLRKNVRKDDLVGRVGGDEFVIFIKNITDEDALVEIANNIILSINEEISDGNHSHNIKASIGISTYPNHGQKYDMLYYNADIALYTSKREGKNIATIFNSEFD